jgi:NTE family protein
MTSKTKLAIACQGGGSHTAFTAGVLKKLLENKVQEKYDLVGLSGTSGGALCATLSWVGLLEAAQGRTSRPVYQRLLNFWRANTAVTAWERALNNFTLQFLRLQDSTVLPAFAPNPYSLQGTLKGLMSMTPRKEYLDFEQLLKNHIPFQEIPSLIQPDSLHLFLGAVNVLSGEFKTFDSKKGEINTEAVRASAAIPNVFTAVQIGDGMYWDGLFSENPPIGCFLASDGELVEPEERPEEIWVILVNPKERDTEPTTAQEILDRRNELSGNLSLFQEIRFIETVNKWVEGGAFKSDFVSDNQLQPVRVRFITMSKEVADGLDYASKLDRSPAFIEMLIEEGENQAQKFWESLPKVAPGPTAVTARPTATPMTVPPPPTPVEPEATADTPPPFVLSFNGIDAKIDVPYDRLLNPESFTIEVWAKVTGGHNYRSVVTSRNDPPLEGYIFYVSSSNAWEFWLGSGEKWNVVGGPTVEPKVWTHLAGSYDRSSQTMGFYINSKEVGFLTGVNFQANSTRPLRIGAGATEEGGKHWFAGEIAEVRLWEGARSSEAIAALMSRRLGGGEPGLLAYWPLDEGVELAILDETENNNHGAISGSAVWIESDLPVEVSE